jgi:hypothetical protein
MVRIPEKKLKIRTLYHKNGRFNSYNTLKVKEYIRMQSAFVKITLTGGPAASLSRFAP